MNNSETASSRHDWLRQLKPFETPSLARSVWQIINTLVPLAILFLIMSYQVTHGVDYLWTLGLSVPAAFFLVRGFIIFHDCTHGSYFSSQMANKIFGFLFGTLMMTSYQNWRVTHSIHHATSSNLDKRGIGDIWTLTLEEYRQSPMLKKILYHVYRNPFFLFILAPPLLFIVLQRFPSKKAGKGSTLHTWLSNLAIIGTIVAIGFGLGWQLILEVYLPSFYVASVLGVWLFFVQHQFDQSYWEHQEHWTPFDAAIDGSSYYKLPKLLQWFSGNIGFHHIHHLKPRIANYNLERAYKAIKELQIPHPLTIIKSLKSLSLHLWDERKKCLLTFRQAARVLKESSQVSLSLN